MINFKKEKDMYDMFIDKDLLTTQDLLNIGFTNKDLTRLVESGKIKRVKRGYYELDSVAGLLTYSKILSSKKVQNYERYRKALEKCAKLEPDNGSVQVRLLTNYLYQRDWENALKCFEVLDKTDNEFYKKDQNLWLYLMSFVTELPEEYKERVSKIKYEDIASINGDVRYSDKALQNKIRSAIIFQKFNEAQDLISSSQECKSKKPYAFVTKSLLTAAINANILGHNYIYELIDEENYSEVVRLLVGSMNIHGITLTDKQLLTLVQDLRLVLEEGRIPEVEASENEQSFSQVIFNHDYKKALQIYEERSQIKSNKYIGILLTKINEEIEKLEIEESEKSKAASKGFNSVVSHLMMHDIDAAITELDAYLECIDAKRYRGLAVDLIKLGLLDNDMAFVDAMYELSGMNKEDYQFDASLYIRDFYYKLVNKDYKKAAIYLDIISMSGDIGGVYIDTSDMKKALVSEMEKAGMSESDLVVALPEPKGLPEKNKTIVDEMEDESELISDEIVEKFYTIPDLVQDVLDGDNVLMLEPMSEEDINTVVEMVSAVPNLQTIVIEEETGDKRIVFRYFNKRDGYIDISEVLRSANNNYRIGMYEDAIEQYESVLPKLETPKSFIYAKLGMAYYKTTYDNDYCEAIDYLTLATAQSSSEDGKYDYTELVSRLKERSGYNGLKVNVSSAGDSSKESSIQYKKDN